jgi:hypothetical protein
MSHFLTTLACVKSALLSSGFLSFSTSVIDIYTFSVFCLTTGAEITGTPASFADSLIAFVFNSLGMGFAGSAIGGCGPATVVKLAVYYF